VFPDFCGLSRTGPIGSDAVRRQPDGLVEAVLVAQVIPETWLAVADYNPEGSSGWKNAVFYSGRMLE
jgi:hypothetical protein